MAGPDRLDTHERRPSLGAGRLHEAAARPERAAAVEPGEVRRLPLDGDEPRPARLVEARHRREQPEGVGVARVVVDLGGLPYCVFDAEFTTPRLGQLSTDLLYHLFESIAIHGRMNLHASVLYGRNDHHKAEGLFKALARALDGATRLDDRRTGVPSTKGTLTV